MVRSEPAEQLKYTGHIVDQTVMSTFDKGMVAWCAALTLVFIALLWYTSTRRGPTGYPGAPGTAGKEL